MAPGPSVPLLELHQAGEHTQTDLAELFNISVYRELQRDSARYRFQTVDCHNPGGGGRCARAMLHNGLRRAINLADSA